MVLHDNILQMFITTEFFYNSTECLVTFMLLGILSCPFTEFYLYLKRNRNLGYYVSDIIIFITVCLAAFSFACAYIYMIHPHGVCDVLVRTFVKLFILSFLFRPFVEFHRYMRSALSYHKYKMSTICMYLMLCLISFILYWGLQNLTTKGLA